MKEGVEQLFQIQLQDDKIRNVQDVIDSIPQTIKELETERDSKAEMVQVQKSKLTENQSQRKNFEKDIQRTRENIEKKRAQLSKATTNKEYQGFITEIKYEEDKISGIEEKIIETMLESDSIMEDVRKSEDDYNSIAEDYNKRIKDFKTDLEYHKKKLEEENARIKEMKEALPQSMLKIYNNLHTKKGGKAISLVETEFCGVCNVMLRPQLLSEVITSDQLVVCEACGRILYKKIDGEDKKGK